MLGGATIHQAKSADGGRADVLTALPPQDDDALSWHTRDTTAGGFPCWEVTPGGDRAVRRFVLLARPDEEEQLSRFTWSAGDVALPPLGRYLMHAAKLRYQARVRGDGSELARVHARTTAALDRLVGLLGDRPAAAEISAAVATAAADEAALLGTLQALRSMRHAVEIARDNMASALPEMLPSDVAFVAFLTRQLDDDVRSLEEVRGRAERTRTLVPVPVPAVTLPQATSTMPAPRPEPEPAHDGRVEQRLGFGVDVVEYSRRSAPQQFEVQRRLAAMARQVLRDAGLDLRDTDRQDAGDGMMVVLPPGPEMHRVLPRLLHGWRARLVADNGAHPEDPIRLRLSVAAGPFLTSAIGFTGGTIIEIGRLLDSAVLRRAVVEHPDADLVVLVSDRLYADVVGEGWPGLDPAQFEPFEVHVKTYRKLAWLWVGAAAAPRPPDRAEPVTDARSVRDVLVIHGGSEPARAALFNFLRAIGLRPLEREELIARTENPAPDRTAVLGQALAADLATIVLLTAADAAARDLLLEAGMALGRQPGRTVIVGLGDLPGIPGLAGREILHIDGESSTALHRLAQRLRNAGCAVEIDGTDWLDTDGFKGF
jgi:hypothetical protein